MKNVQLITWYDWWINKMAKEVADEIDKEFIERVIKQLDESNSI